jgi:hypothetical protein
MTKPLKQAYLLLLFVILFVAVQVDGVSPHLFMQHLAGSSTIGFSGDGGLAISAQINSLIPYVDNTGNIYIPDNTNCRIRRILNGIITTFGGTGTSSTSGTSGPIGSVTFGSPYSVVGDTAGTFLYFSDQRYIWRYTFATNIVSVFAHQIGANTGFGGDGGNATLSQLNIPRGLWLTTSGVLYIADWDNHRIRKIDTVTNIITTVINDNCPAPCPGLFSGDGSPALSARLNHPRGVYMDTAGKLFIADTENYCVRMVNTVNIITTFAGTGSVSPYYNNLPATSSHIQPFDVK